MVPRKRPMQAFDAVFADARYQRNLRAFRVDDEIEWAAFGNESPSLVLLNLKELLKAECHAGLLKSANFAWFATFEKNRTVTREDLPLGDISLSLTFPL